jgi:intein-encoded DNA endonuclease-like protein
MKENSKLVDRTLKAREAHVRKLRDIDLSLSQELSYALGVIFGDGCVSKEEHSYSITLRVIDEDFTEAFRKSMSTVLKRNAKTIYDKRREHYKLRFHSIAFGEWFKSTPEKQLLEIATKYPLDFLRGLFDSEGCAYIDKSHPKHPRIVLVNADEELIKTTHELLQELNIFSTVTIRPVGIKSFYQKENRWITQKRPIYNLKIDQIESVALFFYKVGFSVKRKQLWVPSVLKIDLDSKLIDYWKEDWLKTRKIILKALDLVFIDLLITESPSKKGYHCFFHVVGRPLSDLEVLKAQHLLGDCETRCKINYYRITQRNMKKMWNKMFSKHLSVMADPKCEKCDIRKHYHEIAELEGEDEVWANTVTRQ